MNAQAKHRFVVLDGLRGVAAIMVMLGHSIEHVAVLSFAAVDLFFLLSGFVLMHGYGRRLDSWPGRRGFMIDRLVRLYPLYMLGSLLGVIGVIVFVVMKVWWWTPTMLFAGVAAAPFFLPLPFEWMFPLDPPAWSLMFELIANALLLVVGSRRWPAVAIMLLSAPLLLWSMPRWNDGMGSSWSSLADGFPRVFFSFFLGVLMYHVWAGRRWLRQPLLPWLLMAVPIALYFYMPTHVGRYFALLVFVVQPLLIWAGAHMVVRGWAERILAWLGGISYGLYVLHVPLLVLIEMLVRLALMDFSTEGAQHPYTPFISMPLTLLIAHFATQRFDVPARAWLKRRTQAWRGAIAAREGYSADIESSGPKEPTP